MMERRHDDVFARTQNAYSPPTGGSPLNISTMAALGSSFAAGPGIPPVANKAAMRSERNYAHLTAEALGARLVDATISGATTATILEARQRTGLTRFPPQIESIDPALDFDLVTITAGGNDLGYLGSMLKAGIAERLSRPPLTRPLGRRMRRNGPTHVTVEQIKKATTGLIRVVEEVSRRAPNARIVLADYLTIIGPATRASHTVPFTPAKLAAFRDTGAQLADAFQTAARESSAELVSVSALSEDHGVDACEPWVNGFRLGLQPALLASCFHPNAAGMRAVSRAIVEHLTRN